MIGNFAMICGVTDEICEICEKETQQLRIRIKGKERGVCEKCVIAAVTFTFDVKDASK